VHGGPKLLNSVELAQPLHLLDPIIGPSALSGLKRAVKPQHPFRLEVVRAIV
jgi:hypothetical protein